MKKIIRGHLFVFATIAMLLSCKKETIEESAVKGPEIVTQKIKTWYNSQPTGAKSQIVMVNAKAIKIIESLVYEETKYYSASNTSITPVTVDNVRKGIKTYKYLATVSNSVGEVIKANYFVVLQSNNNASQKAQAVESLVVTPELISLKNIPANFTGAIIKYDDENIIISSVHYENGILVSKTDKISLKVSNRINIEETVADDGPVGSVAPLDEGCSYVTIDWYWQSYENGVLISEEYVTSTIGIVCGGNGGGGSVGGASIAEVAQAAVNTLTSTANATSTAISSGSTPIDDLTVEKLYSWKCVEGFGWKCVAYDKGIQKRVSINKPWKWHSLQNLAISQVGNTITANATITTAKVFADPIIGEYTSTMNVMVNVKATMTYSVAGITGSVTSQRDIPSHMNWLIDSTPLPFY